LRASSLQLWLLQAQHQTDIIRLGNLSMRAFGDWKVRLLPAFCIERVCVTYDAAAMRKCR